jgi:hypothetical protein
MSAKKTPTPDLTPDAARRWARLILGGALGGLALAVLRLIQAGFFVNEGLSVRATAALCTYVAYFLVDGDIPTHKTHKSAFTMGLAGPSILLSLASVGPRQPELERPDPPIQLLSRLFVSKAVAQPESPRSASQGVKRLQRHETEPSFSDALLNAIGRPQPARRFLFVVGTTRLEAKAKELAAALNDSPLLREHDMPSAQVIRPEGGRDLYVVLGSIGDLEVVRALERRIKAIATDAIEGGSRSVIRLATTVLRGETVSALSLFASSSAGTDEGGPGS